jgi:hypothetical protein
MRSVGGGRPQVNREDRGKTVTVAGVEKAASNARGCRSPNVGAKGTVCASQEATIFRHPVPLWGQEVERPAAFPAWAPTQQLFSCEPAGASAVCEQQQAFAPPQRRPRNEEWTAPSGQMQEKRGTPESSVKRVVTQTCVTRNVRCHVNMLKLSTVFRVLSS